jgi:hypothetical protein
MMKTELTGESPQKERTRKEKTREKKRRLTRGRRAEERGPVLKAAEAHALPTESWEPPSEGCVYAGTVGARAASRGAPS